MASTQEIEIRDAATKVQAVADELQDMQGEKRVLNMGLSHLGTHGVLRIELDGEIITKAAPDIGYLHRGGEKIGDIEVQEPEMNFRKKMRE